MAKFCFRSNEINSFFFTFINSGKSVSKPDLLTNAAYELFKAEFNLYLVYGNYINAHLSDLKFMREMSQSFLPEFEMFNRTTVSCNRSFIDPKVDTALINRILNVIHSTFNKQAKPSSRLILCNSRSTLRQNSCMIKKWFFYLWHSCEPSGLMFH